MAHSVRLSLSAATLLLASLPALLALLVAWL
jgi:hypothetical protein